MERFIREWKALYANGKLYTRMESFIREWKASYGCAEDNLPKRAYIGICQKAHLLKIENSCTTEISVN